MKKREQQFPSSIEEVLRRDAAVPKRLDIDLALVQNDFEFGLSGNLFYIWEAPDESSYIEVRINKICQDRIPLTVHTGIRTPFNRLFITTPAGQAGTMTILYGTEAPELLELIDNRSVTVAGVGGVLEELRGDITPENWDTEITVGNAAAIVALAANAGRKAFTLQAKSTNAGIIYIGFDNTVTTTKWIAELQAGMSFMLDDYRGDLYARASAVGQLLGWGEW